MPEGDTIFRAARTLSLALAGRVVTRFDTGYAHLATVDAGSPVAGRTIETVEARGKHLLMSLSDDLILVTHMRMSGSWHVYRPGESWQKARSRARIVLETEAFVAVGFDVPVARFLTAAALARDPQLRSLGPDLLDTGFSTKQALANLAAAEGREVAEALLDQRVMAGLGNVFKSEVLFMAGVNPFALVADLDLTTRARLVQLARTSIRDNALDPQVQAPTYTGLRRTTRRADPRARLWVYGRSGQPCRRCGTPIVERKQGVHARTTFFCPSCQPPRRP